MRRQAKASRLPGWLLWIKNDTDGLADYLLFFGWLPAADCQPLFVGLWCVADCQNEKGGGWSLDVFCLTEEGVMATLIPPGCFSGKTETTNRAFRKLIESSQSQHNNQLRFIYVLEVKKLRKQWQCNQIAMVRWPHGTSQKRTMVSGSKEAREI